MNHKNSLSILFELFPDANWSFRRLSRNPCLSWQIVQKFPDRAWNWYYLSKNPTITWQIAKAHPELPWDYSKLSRNPSVSFTELFEILEFLKLELNKTLQFSKNPNLSLKEIALFPELAWNWNDLASRFRIEDLILLHPNFMEADWDFKKLSKNPELDWALVEAYPEAGWDYSEIARKNQRLSQDIIENNEEIYLESLSLNPKTTEEIYESLIEETWDEIALLTSTEDPRLIRRLLSELQARDVGIPENYLRGEQDEDRLRAGARALRGVIQPECDERLSDTRIRKLIQSRNSFLNWQEVARAPDRINFSALSENQFHHSPERRARFKRISEERFRSLLSLIRANSWLENYRFCVVFPIYLRGQDLRLRKCLNRSPRMLVEN